jgi:hypothetical protein
MSPVAASRNHPLKDPAMAHGGCGNCHPVICIDHYPTRIAILRTILPSQEKA